MYITPSNQMPEPQQHQSPVGSQYPLRPESRVSPIRINVLKSLRLHRVPAIVVALLVLGLGLAVVARHKATYSSASIIYVSPTAPKVLVEDRETERPYESFIQEHVHAISRYDILADALHKLPPGVWQNQGETEQSAVQRLQEALDISRIGQTYQVAISLDGTRPEHLADIVNMVTSVYLEKAKSEEFYGRDDRLNSLKDERAKVQADIDNHLQEQATLTKALGVASFNAKGSNIYDDDNAKVETDLTAARGQVIQKQAQLEALRSSDASVPNAALDAAADDLIASDPGLTATKTQLYQKRAQLVEQLADLTPNNPLRRQSEDQLAQIDKELSSVQNSLRKKAADHLKTKYQTELNQAQFAEGRLLGEMQHGTKLASDAAPKIQRGEAIAGELDRLQARIAAIDERISNLTLESSSPGSVHLFSPAMTPLGPEKSKVALLLVLIFPFAAFLGVATAIALDLLDPHVYTAIDVEAVLGFAPIGMLYDDREVTQMVFDECALRLAAGVDHAARQGGARTFVITGVNSGAGTTSIIENLGSMLAKLGRKTMVIDPSGNSEPVAFVTLGTSLQRRPVRFNEDLTNIPSTSTELQPMRSGQSLPSRIGPINNFVFESFQNVSSEYDIVLIDAAPILLSAETEYLARMADVTILVSEAGKTKKAWLTRAARLLERLGIAGAAAAINKVHPARVEEALKHDLREFELRGDRVNLQDWWRPGKKNAGVGGPIPVNTSRIPEEDEVLAREL